MTDTTTVPAVEDTAFDTNTAAGRLRILWGATADPQLAMSDDEVADVETVLAEHAAMAAEVEQLRAERELLGTGEVQRRIITPGGLIYPPSERDLAMRDRWLPGVRLEQRTVYGTAWKPADPKQAEASKND